MTDLKHIDELALRLQRTINDRLAQIAKNYPHITWESFAEKLADEYLGDEWEWRLLQTIGGTHPIQIAITRYRGHIPDDDLLGTQRVSKQTEAVVQKPEQPAYDPFAALSGMSDPQTYEEFSADCDRWKNPGWL